MVENITPSQSTTPQPGAPPVVGGVPAPDLAEHFLSCSKLGRYLTVSDDSRFVITDDFRGVPIQHEAAAVASIFSKDLLVAQAALLPLGGAVQKFSPIKREKYERLFHLIEQQALSDVVRNSARDVLAANFRNAEIQALEAELGDKLSPARVRYRAFLEVVKQLMDRNITAGPFLDEYRDFTRIVAGKLDFGIYSFCLDRLFGSLRITMKVKKLLVLEIIKYPPIIRRELLTNILAYPGQARELLEFVRYMIASELGKNATIEIELLEAFKLRRLSLQDIEGSLMAQAGKA
ncbi:MAG: hypothetical protein O3B76_11465 [Proteobacteria bacterium]|nr:hypothetical protein [Pseudomonadota bacterium]MDA1024141.1 hypothetical protein [Pseudomonadota bacterium]